MSTNLPVSFNVPKKNPYHNLTQLLPPIAIFSKGSNRRLVSVLTKFYFQSLVRDQTPGKSHLSHLKSHLSHKKLCCPKICIYNSCNFTVSYVMLCKWQVMLCILIKEETHSDLIVCLSIAINNDKHLNVLFDNVHVSKQHFKVFINKCYS